MTRARLLLAFGSCLLALAARAETIRLEPEGGKPFGMRNVFGPLRSLVSGPGYWYGERKIEVDTTPPGATLDLFYVRASFQKRYVQTTAPATLLLPSRSDSGPRDSVMIRAFLPGYRSKEVHVGIESEETRFSIELDPVPNQLEAASQSYFAGRSSLTLLTRQPPVVRFQERPEGFSVVLNETSQAPAVEGQLAGLTSPLVEKIDAQQLGEDLLLRVDLAPEARQPRPELRSRQSFDAARQLHAFTIDLVPVGGAGAESVERMLSALSNVRAQDVTGCAASFDAALRAELGPEQLARALTPSDHRGPFLRAAMKRLGEVSPGGVITLTDGTRLDPASPIELAAAVSQPQQAVGYLALLRCVNDALEPGARRETSFRSLVAPEFSATAFAAALAKANASEQACGATAPAR
ncbi:MAG: hypothetical protein IT386_02300 [Deltaproteobacteria bacterium]|nr:hypothetical protein [Deltaproteobacteria bacterium]